MLYFLTPAIQPRMLVTFDEDLSPLPVTVRVGQAVDVVGQAGKPKTITGFQTHTTPVLLAYGERAELATEECILRVGREEMEVETGRGGWLMEKVLRLVLQKQQLGIVVCLSVFHHRRCCSHNYFQYCC